MAVESKADELFFGGSAGGGKSSLACGLALTKHRNSIIFRKTFPELREIIDQLREYTGDHGRFNRNDAEMKIDDGRRIELGYMQHESDKEKYRGRPKDLIVIDEAPTFSRSQVQFVSGWNRTTIKGQKCRIVLTGNPPTTPEARWIVEEFAPWLDDQFHDPAKPGELRWYIRDPQQPNSIIWSRTPLSVHDERTGRAIRPLSRTFIPSRLGDNPFFNNGEYFARLNSLPEPLRSQVLYGDFKAGTEDDEWQCIPTAWIRAAFARWRPDGMNDSNGTPRRMTSIGVDVARGGNDQTVFAPVYHRWFAPLQCYPGETTPDGPKVARLVMNTIAGERPEVRIDPIGVGASPLDFLRTYGANVQPVNFSQSTDETDKTRYLMFVNVRAAAYWKFREALDPDSGAGIALPPDNQLLADLAAARYSKRPNGILIEPKEKIIERIGRSPDRADAVVMAWYEPNTGPAVGVW